MLVAIYGGASIYFELFPERAERFVRGRKAKPITYHADLDGPGLSAPPRTAAGAPIAPVAPAKSPLAQPMKSNRRKRRR